MIERFSDVFPVRMMCRRLKVSPSGYYDWRDRPLSASAVENERLLVRNRSLNTESDGVLGVPRICDGLRHEAEDCSLNRVARLMQANDIQAVPQKCRWGKKPSGQRPDGILNHLEPIFQAEDANTKWVTNITYIDTDEGWLYLSAVKDLYNGMIVGWSMGPNLT
jgi:putative transposase